jgi:hypothetical protein
MPTLAAWHDRAQRTRNPERHGVRSQGRGLAGVGSAGLGEEPGDRRAVRCALIAVSSARPTVCRMRGYSIASEDQGYLKVRSIRPGLRAQRQDQPVPTGVIHAVGGDGNVVCRAPLAVYRFPDLDFEVGILTRCRICASRIRSS